MNWGGVSADDCGNLFLGDNTNVRQYDANLNLVNTYPMPGAITDVNIANSGILYVCGLGFVATVQPTNIVNCQNSGVLSLTATSIPATCTTPGSATAIVTGGNPPYNLVWNTVPPQFGLTISGVPAGTYTATIVDGGCLQNVLVDSVVVGSIGGVTASSSSTIATCGNNNGTATVTPLTGQAPYTYLWTGGGQTTQTATGLAVGTYTCTITDNMGCTTTQIVAITSNGNITSTYTSTPSGCTTSTGTATVTGAGGQAPYTYLWSNGQTTQTATGFAVGSYSCVVTDNLGCSVLQFISITASNTLTLSISSTPTGCTTSIGTATAITGNGTQPYSYSWSNGQTGITATGLGLGNVTCTVTDNGGCTITQSTNIISNNPITLTFTQTPTGCTVNNGTATITASNGALPYTYSWTNGQTVAGATGLGIGSYTCTVTDANGCIQTQPVNIVSNNPVTVTFTQTPTGCTVNNGTATINAANGALPYTYSWTNGQTTAIATGLGIGSYTCTVTDANGCARTQPVSIVSNNPVTLAMSTTPTGCTVNIGTATATAGNGALPYTYNWSNGQITSVATALGIGTYTVTVTDNNGCSRMDSIHVLSTNPVTMKMTSTQTFCTGQTGTATATPANGALPYTYLWSNGQTTPTATALDSGAYVCTATDANGCTRTLSVHITVTNPVILTCDSTQTGCTPPTGTATANPTNGAAPYIYVWSNGQTSQTASGLGVGGYIVTVTDNDGCTAIGTTTVTQFPLPIVAISPASITITAGENAVLNASGGTSYHWYPSEGLSCATCPSTTATPGQPTTYCVAVKDVHGCRDSTCVRVEVLCNAGLLDKLIPTAFSPNNDGMNDVLCMPENTCINSFELDIYDRWGEKVFMTTDINNCWDGTYKGATLGTAAFVYIFEASLSNGAVYKQKGTISLIK